MPVLRFNPERITALTDLTLGEVREALFRLKCETGVEEGWLEVEVNPDRPDLYIGEGVARAVNGLIGKRRGWRPPRVVDSGYTLEVTPPPARPYIAAAVVYNVSIDEEYLAELIQFQEKLHDTIGRRRRKVAIGIHDLDKLPGRRLRYVEESLDAEMTPLDSRERLPIRRVLESTPQGEKYGGISLDASRGTHPALYSGGEIISIPPVINSDITRLEAGTRHVLIDVTGTHSETVSKVLDIIVTALSERPGAYVGTVRVEAPGAPVYTPLLSTKTLSVDARLFTGTLGVDIPLETVVDSLERMLHNVEARGGQLEVTPPPFRVDVLGGVDLAEDVAIAVGYEALGYKPPVIDRPGSLLPESRLSRVLRDLAIGLGYTEVAQLTLTSPVLLDYAGFEGRVEVSNPVQYEYSALRPSLIPSLLTVASRNIHAIKPLRVFEVGFIVKPGHPPSDSLHMGMLIMDDEVGFEDIQAAVYSILEVLGVDFRAEPALHPTLIRGRAARLLTDEGRELAVLGEVDPGVLEKLGIPFPIAVAELDVEVIASWRYRTMSLQ